MPDDDRFRIYQQLLGKLRDAFGVPVVPTVDEAIAWIARHYGPVGVPPEGDRPAAPAILQGVALPPDGEGIRRTLDGPWSWATDTRTGGPALYGPPDHVVRIEAGNLELYGTPTVSIRNLLCLLAVHMGDYRPATLQRMGLDGYPDAPEYPPQAVSFDTPIFWYFPLWDWPWRRTGKWDRSIWSHTTRNGGWFGYSWTRLIGKSRWGRKSNWARLTIRFFIPRRRP